jgi:adenylate cyclase
MAARLPGPWRLRSRAPLAGAVMAGFAAATTAVLPGSFTRAMHERTLDTLLALAAPSHAPPSPETSVVVVDIDRRSLAAIGPWPWPRRRIAALVTAVSRSGARAIAIDILFAGADAKSPATLARRLGADTARPDIVAWADELEDGDRLLAEALGGAPVSLGFVLDPNGTDGIPGPPFLTRGTVALPEIWRAPGATAPFATLLQNAAGLGALALAGDEDGLVRRVPLLVGVAGRVHPGLAAEAVRLAQRASAYRIDGDAATIAFGGEAVPLPPDGMLRLLPGRRHHDDFRRRHSGEPAAERKAVRSDRAHRGIRPRTGRAAASARRSAGALGGAASRGHIANIAGHHTAAGGARIVP